MMDAVNQPLLDVRDLSVAFRHQGGFHGIGLGIESFGSLAIAGLPKRGYVVNVYTQVKERVAH